MENVYAGRVKWFSPEKGFGFIEVEVDGHPIDVFVSYSSIQTDGFKTLKKSQKVRFRLERDDRGPFAKNVEIL